MADRVVRDELLRSDRWLDLPSDSHRLIYENMLLIADDFGNIEGGPRRLFRWMHSFSQVKTEADSIKVMIDLQDADLVRRYEVADKEYWHLPRFKNSRWYWARKYPKSPYPEEDIPKNQRYRQKTRQKRLSTRRGVGVGVGVSTSTLAQTAFARLWAIYPKKKSKALAEKAFARIHPDEQLLQTILDCVERAKNSDDWRRESGRYIPYPASWLNARGWEDEAPAVEEKKVAW